MACLAHRSLRVPAVRRLGWLCLCALLGATAAGQTFEINSSGQVNSAPAKRARGHKSGATAESPSKESSGIGWGSSIEVSRQARAAQQALQKGDYRSAAAYAERAAKAAPQVSDFWFLYGYASRLSGQYSNSVEAFQRGLQVAPNSVQGLSGLAQTYARMGKRKEAQDILDKVLAANPRSPNDLSLAGELMLDTDPQRALGLLERSDSIKPAARSELLVARAYQRLKQPQQSRQWLDRAQARAPHDPDVLRSVAGLHRDNHEYAQAIAILKSVRPQTPSLIAETGYTYQLAGKKKEAAASYAQAAHASPKDLNLQLSAAQSQVNVGDYRRADDFLHQAESLDPANYRLFAVRGQIDDQQHNPEGAIHNYEQALQHMPAEVPEGMLYPIEIRLSLYDLYRDTQQAAAAEKQLQQARTAMSSLDFQNADRPEFLRLRAALSAAGGNYAAAEKDLNEALSMDPSSVNITLNFGQLLWKEKKNPEAMRMFAKAVELDPGNASALSAMGYLSRDMGDPKAAEGYFTKLASLHPDDFVAYLALGDLYTARKEIKLAQQNYEKAYKLSPQNPIIIAGGINSALEGHEIPTAKSWIDRADDRANQNPQVMRERERYLSFNGEYLESAELGYKVIQLLPRDPEGSVYLAYDLLFLGRYDEARKIVMQFQPILPKDRDLPLVAGYVHVHDGLLHTAVDDFTRAVTNDPNMATGYMNRGFVYNDLREGAKATKDFETALKLNPNYGEAHLGLAFALLQNRHAKQSIQHANAAYKILGNSAAIHLALAEGYRQQVLLAKAEKEYDEAIQLRPDKQTYMALSDVQYRQRHYNDSINTLKAALQVSPQDPEVYARTARSYARMHDKQQTLLAIQNAERYGRDSSVIQVAVGDGLLELGDRQLAMNHYAEALNQLEGDRVDIRLSIARLFAREGSWNAAREQVGIGFAEARVGGQDITAEQLLDAADIFLQIHDYDLAKRYFERAQADGADPEVVAVGMANAYLAQGQTASAEAQLTSLGNSDDYAQDYGYLLAMGNVYRQKQQNSEALSYIARAQAMNQDDPDAERAELSLAGDQGMPLPGGVNMITHASLAPIFEDINIYQMDARLRSVVGNSGLLPPPRHSIETLGLANFRFRHEGWPLITSSFSERNARGTLLFPSDDKILHRNTYDTIFNGAVSPVVHLAGTTITFTPGLQFTIRRDSESPHDMNQNLFRQFLYLNTGAFGNWVSISGQALREAGPFTDQNLHSRDASAQLEFRVGRPWGRTALITGYGARDVLFRPLIREYYTTATYAGIEHRFGEKLSMTVLGEYLRSWRVQDRNYALGQAMRPAFRASYQATRHWSAEGAFVLSRGQGYHAYDNIQNQFLVSYVRPMHGSLNDGLGTEVSYPMRFSFGIQMQTFYDFPGHGRTDVLPVIRLNLF
jgi:tetratricopeptide (TPR) repeat protein